MNDFEDKFVYGVRAMDASPDGRVVALSIIAEGDPEDVMPRLAEIIGEAYLMKYGEPPDRIFISPLPYHPAVDDDDDGPAWLEDQSEFLDGPEI